ncbi:MAG: S9 family peptidase, partial [Acidimicrobiales bacterium]
MVARRRSLAFGARSPDPDRNDVKPKDQPPRRLTRLFTRLDNVGWLHGRHRRVYVVPADGNAKPRPLTDGEPDTSGLAVSPNGAHVAYAAARHDTWDLDLLEDLWIASVDGNDEPARKLTATDRVWAQPSFSPDGSRLACTDLGEPWSITSPRVSVIDVSSGETTAVTAELDRPCLYMTPQAPAWVGDDLVFSAEDRGNVHLFRAPADGSGKPEALVAGDRWVHAFDATGDVVAFAASDPTTLPEVFVRGPGGDERCLTTIGREFAARVDVSAPQRFTATSADGTEVEGWYLSPAAAGPGGRYPTLLNVHGGPFTQYGNRFFDEFQYQAGAGYGVVYCNPRGSAGYGDDWGRSIAWPKHPAHPGSGWGRLDADDVLAVLDEACRRFDSVDADRIGVIGGSYGGYMTSWLLSHSDRFKAGCSERSANDLVALEESSDIASVFRGYTGVSHLEDREAYAAHSPSTFVADIHTPLLIVHSEGDLRCPIGQADALFTALRVLGRDVEMLRFPEESHELSRSGAPKHRVQRAEAILAWFDHLKP